MVMMIDVCTGCVNGGGQLRPLEKSTSARKELLSAVSLLYNHSTPTTALLGDCATDDEMNGHLRDLSATFFDWLEGGIDGEMAEKWLYTDFHKLQTDLMAQQNFKW